MGSGFVAETYVPGSMRIVGFEGPLDLRGEAYRLPFRGDQRHVLYVDGGITASL